MTMPEKSLFYRGQNKNVNDTRANEDGLDFRRYFCQKVKRGEMAKSTVE
jgi:hypothetical protein